MSIPKHESIDYVTKPEEFFKEKICAAISKQNIKVSEDIEFYLVSLLSGYVISQESLLDTPIALILKEALESPPTQQIKLYKKLGDTSLYIGGYFQGYFKRKTFDLEYFVAMGSHAYGALGSILRDQDRAFSDVYGHLATDFWKYIEVVAEVSDSMSDPTHPQDILTLYDRWSENQSSRLQSKLKQMGIVPILNPRTKQ